MDPDRHSLCFYRPEITASFAATALTLFRITATMLVLYFLIYFVSPPTSVNRVLVLFFGVLSLTLIGGWRAIYTATLHRALFEQRVLIVGAGHTGQVIARAIHENLDRTYRIVGFVDGDATTWKRTTVSDPGGHGQPRAAKRQYGISDSSPA